MSGTAIRIGRYRTASGPDLAVVYWDEQVASFTSPASHASQLILYKGGTWAGRYQGVPAGRIGLHWAATDANSPGGKRPGGVAAYTNTFSPTVAYTGANEGEYIEAALTTPFLTEPNYAYTVSVMNSAASPAILGVAMFQASAISETNEWFYRKDNSGTIPVDAGGSATSNEGQLVAWFEGEANVKPNTPTALSPSGSNLLIGTKPTLTANFSDPNETLNNGVAWDKLTSTKVTIRTGSATGTIVWQTTYDNSSAEQSARKSTVTCGATLSYGTTYYYTVEHKDRAGQWSNIASTSFSIKSPNAAPYAPDQLSPSGTNTGTLTPLLSMRHRDPEGQATSMVHMQVRRKSSQAILLDKSWSASVAHNGYVNRTYDGSSLAYDTSYEFRGRTMDTVGAWGTWSGWTTFSIMSLSGVGVPSSPVGYQGSQTPANIVAKYTHTNGVASNAFKVALYNENDAYIAGTGWIAKSVANNANVTITWAETGFGAMPWAAIRSIRLLSRDTNNVVATAWSPSAQFNINAPPSVPSGLSPNGPSFGSRPLLVVTNISDFDPVHPKSSLIVKAVLTTSAGTFTRTMPWNNAMQRWEYQTTSTDLPTQGSTVNQWQVYAGDGIVWSGGTTVEANAAKSGVATFVYANVPNVVITGPASPTQSTTPTLTWTSSEAQQNYRVYGYMGGSLIYDSGVVTTGITSHTISPTKFLLNEQWNTGETIAFEVVVTSTLSLTGTSPQVSILLQYDLPPSLTLAGSPAILPQTRQSNAVELWHDPTTVSAGAFEGYVWRRTDLDPNGSPIAGTTVVLAVIMDPSVTQFLDASVVSGQSYRWSVTVRERRGNDIVESSPSTYTGKVEWKGVVIHAPSDPLNTAVEFFWGAKNVDYSVNNEWVGPVSEYESIQGGRLLSFAPVVNRDARGSFTLRDGPDATAAQRMETLNYLLRYQRGAVDAMPHTVCWRSGRGGINGIIYGAIEASVSTDYERNGSYGINIGIKEIA